MHTDDIDSAATTNGSATLHSSKVREFFSMCGANTHVVLRKFALSPERLDLHTIAAFALAWCSMWIMALVFRLWEVVRAPYCVAMHMFSAQPMYVSTNTLLFMRMG
jgi:hypothetical protein